MDFVRKKMWKKVTALLVASFVATAGLSTWSGLTRHVDAAAKSETLVVKHAVRLRSHTRFGRDVLQKLAPGTKLDVIFPLRGWDEVRTPSGKIGYVVNWPYYVRTSLSTINHVPPGVRYDASVHPKAGLGASWQAKFNAVVNVAESKLGTPYRWGHNEDRGQYGFDCSNFTAYVYHHALGYRMSGASRTQARSIGYSVSRANMRPGDLIIFNGGSHVGIYLGNNRMIEEGGGLGKVGYLSVAPGSYWGNHITAVKRMF